MDPMQPIFHSSGSSLQKTNRCGYNWPKCMLQLSSCNHDKVSNRFTILLEKTEDW